MEDKGRGAMAPKHHLVIAGTGRAVTSFLVRFLTACGVETEITKSGDTASWNEGANAGFETFPLGWADLPYVIKQPWLYEFAERFLSQDDVRVDAAVIPIRDLMQASSSRVIREMQAMHEHQPGLTCSGTTWKTWAHTPGGVVRRRESHRRSIAPANVAGLSQEVIADTMPVSQPSVVRCSR